MIASNLITQGVLRNAGPKMIAGLAIILAASFTTQAAHAGCPCGKSWPHFRCTAGAQHGVGHLPEPGDISNQEFGGTYYWMRSPEQERRVAMTLYNRYCIRCHGVDGRGVWDIPDVPDFTNTVWQASRPEAYRTRVVLEGRGAVMPSFRGTLTLEEACALGRYLNSFVPGNEVSRPGLGHERAESAPPAITPNTTTPAAGSTPVTTPAATPTLPPPGTIAPSPFKP